jgi:formyltetrahydrofolate deformylase
MRISYQAPVATLELIELDLQRQAAAEDWDLQIHAAEHKPRVAILCSREDHCLSDLLWRFHAGELAGKVVGVYSTQPGHDKICQAYDAQLTHVAVGSGGMAMHERELLESLRGNVDLVVLARYMRILSGEFLDQLGVPVINIHHSFLPSFVGMDPYGQAHERGVKLIGATAHYAVEELDAGPIIEQDIVRVSHRQGREDLRMTGRDVERVVLARAVKAHLEGRVVRWDNRTIVF